jgi:hypothetical protein
MWQVEEEVFVRTLDRLNEKEKNTSSKDVMAKRIFNVPFFNLHIVYVYVYMCLQDFQLDFFLISWCGEVCINCREMLHEAG